MHPSHEQSVIYNDIQFCASLNVVIIILLLSAIIFITCVLYIEVKQIPLPTTPIILDGSYSSGDIKQALKGHYNFIVAYMKVNILCFILH